MLFVPTSDEEMEESNPIEANDSDYDPNKEAKKEVHSVVLLFTVSVCVPADNRYAECFE